MSQSLIYSVLNRKKIFKNALRRLGFSENHKVWQVFENMINADPYCFNFFEIALSAGSMPGFLIMDCDAYASLNPKFFLLRVEFFRKILAKFCLNPQYDKIIKILEKQSVNPMDLYFNFYTNGETFSFLTWLSFGGLVKSGSQAGFASFWPYNFDAIISDSLAQIDFIKAELPDNMVNFGFEIGENEFHYKYFYYFSGKVDNRSTYATLMKQMNKVLEKFKFYYFFCKTYNKYGKLVGEELFVELANDVIFSEPDDLKILLAALAKLGLKNFDETALMVSRIGRSLNLISFDQKNKLTFYARL